MKKICTILLLALLVCALLSGCGTPKPSGAVDLVAVYSEKAQEYLDSSDPETAMAVLKEGFDLTGSEELKEQLKAIQSQPEKAPEKKPEPPKKEPEPAKPVKKEPELFDLSPYVGWWSPDTSDPTKLVLGIFKQDSSDTQYELELSYVQSPPFNRVAEYSTTLLASDVTSNQLTLECQDDGWGHSGTFTLSIAEDQITCDIKMNPAKQSAMWGFPDIQATLTRNDDIWDIIQAEQDAYQDPYGDDNLANSFSADDQNRINVFLSNFSEQGFASYDSKTPNDRLINFAFLYNKINAYNRVEIDYENSLYIVKEAYINSTLNYFFGKSVPTPKNNTDVSDWMFYSDGYYCTPAADGEWYGYFTVVDEMYLRDDGNYDVHYNVYSFSPDVYFSDESLSPYYHMNESAASQCTDLTYLYDGKAVVADCTLNDGSPSYHLISYSPNRS